MLNHHRQAMQKGEKRYMSLRSRLYAHRFRTLVVVLAFTVACSPQDASGPQAITIAEFERAVSESIPFQAMKRLLPDEYNRAAIQITSTLDDRSTDEEIRRQTKSALVDVLRANSAVASRASSDLILRWLDLKLAALEAVKANGGDVACGAYAQSGQPPSDYTRLVKSFDDQILELEFEMIADGRTRKGDASPLTQEDLFLLGDSLMEAGISAEEIERHSTGDRAPSLACRYALAAFRAAREIKAEPGQRIMAEYVRMNLAGR